MVHAKNTQWLNPIPIEILYKPKVVVNLMFLFGLNICIYNGLNGSSFYQVGACLQVESCYEGWIPHILVGSKINKMGLFMKVGFLIS
jgi:hypothetical protein